MKTIERAHTPKNLWQRIRLKKNYAQVNAGHSTGVWGSFPADIWPGNTASGPVIVCHSAPAAAQA
jgi:hypothetical protein